MAGFSANQQFSSKKKKTMPVVKCPRNVKNFLNISQVYENGIFRIEPGKGRGIYDRCYIFEDINYINQDDNTKETILLQLMKWLNSMNTDFKIIHINEYQNMFQMIKKILGAANSQYPLIKEGMSRWIKDKMEEGTPNIRSVKQLIVTCSAQSAEEAQIYFNNLDTQLRTLFGGWKSNLYIMDAYDRLKCLHGFFRDVEEPCIFRNSSKKGKELLKAVDWKNSILPGSIDSFHNFMVIGDKYVSVLFGHDYDSAIDEGKFFHSLSSVSYPSIITLDYAPVDKRTLKEKLASIHTNNEKSIADEIDSKQKRGQVLSGISYSKEKRKEELEEYRDQIDDNSERSFFMGLLTVVTAETEDKLAERVASIKSIARENGVLLDTYNWRQLKALNTALPIGGRQVDHMRSFLTSSAVAFQPYYAKDLQEIGGTVYGKNRTTHNLVIGNRKKLLSPHGMIVGHTGSGKSQQIKMTEIAQTLLSTDDDIFGIDPQNELEVICNNFHGEYFDFTPKGNLHMNSFEVPEEVFRAPNDGTREQFVADQTEYAVSFCTAIMKNIVVTQEHASHIGRCIRNMYREIFGQKKLKKQPTIKDLREEIRKEMGEVQEKEDVHLLRQIYNSLEEYTDGSYDMFAYPSNVNIRNRFTVFGLKNVPESLWEPVMITIMHFLATRMEYNQELQRATHFIVDETQVVCANKSSADMLLKAIVTYRKYGGICTMALQNLTRAVENEELRDMFSNCGYKCFLDQGGVDALSLSKIQELSTKEFQSLTEEKPGHGVMVWGKKVILVDAYMDSDNPLYSSFSTNFHEKAEINENEVKTKLVIKTEQKKTVEKERQKESAGRERAKKETLYKACALSPVNLREAALLINTEEEEARQLLEVLCEIGYMNKTDINGTVQYTASNAG